MCMRSNQGFADPTPTLVDIERTHILFINAHFKPLNVKTIRSQLLPQYSVLSTQYLYGRYNVITVISFDKADGIINL